MIPKHDHTIKVERDVIMAPCVECGTPIPAHMPRCPPCARVMYWKMGGVIMGLIFLVLVSWYLRVKFPL